MKKKVLSVLIVLALLFTVLSYFHVDGSELPSIDALSDGYSITVVRTNTLHNSSQQQTYTLSPEQIHAVQKLLRKSQFTRRLSHSYSYKGLHDIYSILLERYDDAGKQVDFIQIFFVEDLYLSISAPYANERLTLRILNDDLDEKLDQILIQK